MPRSHLVRTPLGPALVAMLVASCPGTRSKTDQPPSPVEAAMPPTPSAPLQMVDSRTPGLLFRLREALDVPGGADRARPAQATPLSDADTRKVLARLDPLAAEPDDEKSFALREKSLPPPRTGRAVKEPFPPPVTAPPPDRTEQGPLRVLRHMPEGEVPLAPHLSVTFSQPMVAVTSQDEAAKVRPVKLTPEPAGAWRWVGTKTVLFEPALLPGGKAGSGRFPMATEYRVDIPQGTRSATGGTLDRAETWSFRTPPPVLATHWPSHGPTVLQPLLFVSFDQRIDPQAVLPTIHVAGGPARPALRLATEAEIAADATVKRLVETAEPGRWLAFVPTTPLAPDTEVKVRIGPGTPSAEGPLKTAKAQGFSFRTYGPMKVTWQGCEKRYPCPPLAALSFSFSNPIDQERFDPESMVRVEPPLPGLKIDSWGQQVIIRGRTKGRARYKVSLAASIPDNFGQTLGRPDELTFHTGSAHPQLYAPGGGFVVLDPAGDPRFSVYSINHKRLRVKVFAAGPDTWAELSRYMREVWHREAYPPDPPGKRVTHTVVDVKGAADELTETRIDLAPALQGGKGSVILLVEPEHRPRRRWDWQPVIAWVQFTGIGIDAFADGTELLAWTTDLATGAPLAGATVSLQPGGATVKTEPSGLATLPMPAKRAGLLVARRGDDVAFLPHDFGWWGDGGWGRSEASVETLWYVVDDRKMYKPGEEVKLKGWLRRLDNRKGGDVMGLGRGGTVSYVVRDAVGNEVLKGQATLNALAGFDTAFKLPRTMNLGTAQVELKLDGKRGGWHAFEVQEFRRPEFEVTAQADGGPYLIGGSATVTVAAAYYAGGGLTNAETRWDVRVSPGHFSPPGHDEWAFGPQPAWWGEEPEQVPPENLAQHLRSTTDSAGRHMARIDFLAVNPPRPMDVTASATVMDVNRQAWTASANLLVHPGAHYVGLRPERPFVGEKEPVRVDAVVTDLDGKRLAGRPIEARLVRLDWEIKGGRARSVEADPLDCTLTSAKDPVRCELTPRQGGLHRLTAFTRDEAGRRNLSQVLVWVAGGKVPPERGVAQETVRLIPDRKEYKAGDVAEIAVVVPFYPAEGLLSLRRSGLVRHERFKVSGPSHTVKVRIEESWTPNVTVGVDLVGSAPRTDDAGNPDAKLPRRPAFAAGQVALTIPPLERKLALDLVPQHRALEPGGKTTLDVAVKDSRGEPVAGAEVLVVVVDESVLSLTGYRLPDPLGFFYRFRGADVTDHHLRQAVLLARPDELLAGAPGGDRDGDALMEQAEFSASPLAGAVSADKVTSTRAPAPPPAPRRAAKKGALRTETASTGEDAPQPIKVRVDFNALAVFAPSVTTGADGRAGVPVKVPDNLTRYRVMAVAVAGERRFGAGESAIVARLPLMVRPSPPRFLNFGDTFELPVVVQNQTDRPLEVDVAVRARNARVTAGQGRRVTVPANDRVEVRFPAAAARAGIARFQIGAVSGRHADASQFQLPVWTPATTEAFATYGVIDKGAIAQPVKLPGGVVTEFGGLEITTSSTALQALTDAVLYLVRYPYECTEQMASRIIAIAALRDVLTAFQAEGLPSPKEMEASVKKDLELLQRLQNGDGGWAFWRRGDESWPFLTEHVAHALARARAKGFAVPAPMIDRVLPYLRNIESHIPRYYDKDTRRACIAYAVYVRTLLGDRDPARARKLIAEAGGVDKLPIEATGWIYPTLSGDAGSKGEVAAIRRFLENRVEETAAAAHFVTSYGDGSYLLLHSDRRVDGILLDALIIDQPRSDVIPKLVEGLLGHRKAGHWENTQENAWVLLALDRYFDTYEKLTPDFVARAWLGDRYAGEHRFKGRTTERSHIDVPMATLAEVKQADLVLQKDGAGRLYYRIGMSYAPANLRLPPADRGFTVERIYQAVDDPADVRREADGTWRIRAGARVRVRLTMLAQARRTHVALVDPLPAGLEAQNPALAVTGPLPKDPGEQQGPYWWWWRPWFEHQNMRDERVEAFTSLLWEGVHTYSYVARATTPGVFVVPPAKAEEMYHPETFGRSAGDRVVID